jgi:hypothetical protein
MGGFHENESLAEYAQRIAKNIRNPVLIGVSFGEILDCRKWQSILIPE